jgi:predicted helicase
MVNFLKTYQIYDQRFEHVWLWNQWPYHQQVSSKDTGIDLVAKTTDDEYWAIQCKCYKDDAYINKSELDKFLGLSRKKFIDEAGANRGFSARLWISTTNNWSSEAQAL